MSVLFEFLFDMFAGAALEGASESRSPRVRKVFFGILTIVGIAAFIGCIYIAIWIGGDEGMIVASCFAIITASVLWVMHGSIEDAQREVEARHRDQSIDDQDTPADHRST